MQRAVGSRSWVLVLLTLFVTSCAEPEAEGPRSLVGSWESKTFLSQLGPGVLRYEFHADGRFEMAQRLEALPTAPLGAQGTWRLEGTRLFHDEKPAYEVSWDGPVLVLTEKNGDAYRLERKEPSR